MASFKQIGLAGAAAAVIIGGIAVADTVVRNKSKSRPDLRQEQTENQEKEDLEKMVWQSQAWTVNDKEASAELHDYRLPLPIKFSFINNETERAPSEKVLYTFHNRFVLPLLNDYASTMGNRGFTGGEILQLMSFYVDKLDRKADLFEITGVEVEDAIRKYEKEGIAGFKIRLEKMLEPEKAPMLSNKKRDVIEDVKEQERRAYEGFKAGQKYAEGFKRGHEQYTREQLDQYANWRQATIDSQLNARLYQQCRRR